MSAALQLPFTVADYVDFYASRTHADERRPDLPPRADPLPPNWQHLPIGYHGRAGTVVGVGHARSPAARSAARRRRRRRSSGRPAGSTSRPRSASWSARPPVGRAGAGRRLRRARVRRGACVNDWSARDIQAWEYVPLGPFLGKSFATSISPGSAAGRAERGPGAAPRPRRCRCCPICARRTSGACDLDLQVELNGTVIARPPFESMYWTPAQMLAHMTVNGASLRTGDLFASGTVSGPARDQRGCLLELTADGREQITLDDGSTRGYLADGDEVVITATAPGAAGRRIGLGEVRGRIVTART